MQRMLTACPACDGTDLELTVDRPRLPAMQNYVHRSFDGARLAKVGSLTLAVCRDCGFGFNARFNPGLLDYDESYDNSVPSAVMGTYYETIARHLYETYVRGNGLVVDVGCGKGTFLQTLTRLYPEVRGLGIDPSYEGPLEPTSSLRFVREFFDAGQLTERPSLVICRHVLEHIGRPVDFLRSLRNATAAYPGVPFFLEVPDLTWILRNQAFWDFCYEHCNYFSAESLTRAVDAAGFQTLRTRAAFGDQYLWIEATNHRAAGDVSPTAIGLGSELCRTARLYDESETRLIEHSRGRLLALKREGWSTAVWGMATKGILFSYLVDPETRILDYCLDVNPNKQNGFAPVTAHRIQSPDVLASADGPRGKLAVVVMNENYLPEIRERCRQLGVDAELFAADMSPRPHTGATSHRRAA